MSIENESSRERQKDDRTNIRRLFSDIRFAHSYAKLQEAAPDYIAREYDIESPSEAWHLAHSLQTISKIPAELPSEEDFDTDPARAKDKMLVYMYGGLVPLYENEHTPEESAEFVEEVIKYVTKPNSDHDPDECIDSLYRVYRDCNIGACPPRYIVASVNKELTGVVDWYNDNFEDSEMLERHYEKVRNHILALSRAHIFDAKSTILFMNELNRRVTNLIGDSPSPKELE